MEKPNKSRRETKMTSQQIQDVVDSKILTEAQKNQIFEEQERLNTGRTLGLILHKSGKTKKAPDRWSSPGVWGKIGKSKGEAQIKKLNIPKEAVSRRLVKGK